MVFLNSIHANDNNLSEYNRYIIKSRKDIKFIQSIKNARLEVEADEIESIEVLMFGKELKNNDIIIFNIKGK